MGSGALLGGTSSGALRYVYSRVPFNCAAVAEVNPDVEVEAGPLLDPKEPTAAAKRPEMGALVVSRETLPGGTEINRQREGFGFAPLRHAWLAAVCWHTLCVSSRPLFGALHSAT